MNTPKTIVLLRGINVGGSGKLAMADLRASLENAGCTGVQTYIQSGNIVLDGPVNAAKLQAHIAEAHGLDCAAVCVSSDELREMIEAVPFDDEGNRIVLAFYVDEQRPESFDKLAEVATGGEAFLPFRNALVLHYPNGQANSRMAGQLEKWLSVSVTARNFRTAKKLLELAEAGN